MTVMTHYVLLRALFAKGNVKKLMNESISTADRVTSHPVQRGT